MADDSQGGSEGRPQPFRRSYLETLNRATLRSEGQAGGQAGGQAEGQAGGQTGGQEEGQAVGQQPQQPSLNVNHNVDQNTVEAEMFGMYFALHLTIPLPKLEQYIQMTPSQHLQRFPLCLTDAQSDPQRFAASVQTSQAYARQCLLYRRAQQTHQAGQAPQVPQIIQVGPAGLLPFTLQTAYALQAPYAQVAQDNPHALQALATQRIQRAAEAPQPLIPLAAAAVQPSIGHQTQHGAGIPPLHGAQTANPRHAAAVRPSAGPQTQYRGGLPPLHRAQTASPRNVAATTDVGASNVAMASTTRSHQKQSFEGSMRFAEPPLESPPPGVETSPFPSGSGRKVTRPRSKRQRNAKPAPKFPSPEVRAESGASKGPPHESRKNKERPSTPRPSHDLHGQKKTLQGRADAAVASESPRGEATTKKVLESPPRQEGASAGPSKNAKFSREPPH